MKCYMVSLGCAKNQVDSEMILGLVKRKMEIVSEVYDADIVICNTCAFIESARKEAVDTIFNLKENMKPDAKLIVCGCLAQRYKAELEKIMPEVNRFIAIEEYSNLAKILNDVCNSKFDFDDKLSPLNKVVSTPNYMRYIKISEGCLNRCAFCAIPLIRGNLVSRTIEDITEEVRKEVMDGAYEINLISQDTTKYGYDIYKELKIVDLLKSLIAIPYDFKIRLLYLYPDIVTDELLELMASSNKIMHYFDIPIQHSENKILKKMLRRGSREYMLDLFKKIKTMMPDAIFRTTFIVGFPYEDDADFENLLKFVEDVKFDRLGAFTFSLEEGTPATKYPNEISESLKQKRYEALMDLQSNISRELNCNKIGMTLDDCFIIGYDEESYMYLARNYMFAPDDIDGVIYVAAKDELELGQRIKVKVLDADEYTLTGEQIVE